MKNKFLIEEQKVNDLLQIKISNTGTGEYFTVLPDAGARLNEVVFVKENKHFGVVKTLTSPEFKARDQRFNNAKLFPFAGRIKDGMYNFNGNDYKLFLNYPEENNACHGFVYDRQFKVIGSETTEHEASVTLEYIPAEIQQGYPFKFKILITYILQNSGVTCVTKVENTGNEEMLFSDGWHHYFRINDRKVDSLLIKSEVNVAYELTNHGIPTGKSEKINLDNPELISDRKFDNVYGVITKDKAVTSIYSEEDNINLNIWQQAGEGKYKFLVVYTPPGRDSIAVEPITNNTNSFNNKQNIILLQPGETWEGRMGFFIQ